MLTNPIETPRREKAVVYARYSSHNQREESIEGQLRDAYAYAERNGYDIIAEYADQAKSGKSDQRPEFQRMLKDAEKKQFTVVLVWKQDRFMRNRYESATDKMKLKKNGVRVVSVMESISDTPEGIIMEGLLESMAEYYSANLSQNIKRGMRENLQKGKLSGHPAPYGYKLADGKLLQDETAAPIVRYIFEEYASGKTKKEIFDVLRARGVKSPKGRELSASSYAKLLENPAYCGKVVQMGIEVDCVPDPIISEELFLRVQERVKARKRAPAASKAKEEYLLQGKCFCGLCGSTMAGECGYGNHGIMYHYYSCHARKKHRRCSKHNERKEALEDLVVRAGVQFIRGEASLDLIADAVVASYEKEYGTKQIADLERQHNRIECDLNNVIDAIAQTPAFAQARLIERLSQMEKKRDEIQKEIAQLKLSQPLRLTKDEIKDWLRKFSAGDVRDPDFRRWVVDVLISAVYVYDDKIVVFYSLRGASPITFQTAQPLIEEKAEEIQAFSSFQKFGFDGRCSTDTRKP